MNKFGTMLPDILKSLFRRPATEQYPFVRPETVERLRGLLKHDPARCTGCGLCAMDCPAMAIELNMIDRKAKAFYLTYHTDRCMFCGQCVVSCRQGSLHMSNQEWELASQDKADFVIYFGDKENAERVLASQSESQSESAEPCEQD